MTAGPTGVSTLSPEPFEPGGPLPSGTTLLEASAGTGKTYAIAGLAARYVAEEGVDLATILVVTFGRSATSEVRERVRDRIAEGVRTLASGGATEDPYLAHLAHAESTLVERRTDALRLALSDFDAATIVTVHQFCSRVLAGLGIAGDIDRREQFAQQSGEFADEAIAELYLRDVAVSAAAVDAMPFASARTVARAALGDPHARLMPNDAEPASAAGLRVRFADDVRREVARRKRARLEMDYDDLLTRVRDAINRRTTRRAAVARLQQRYRVVLVDEFQDTDPVQWEILRCAFHGHVPLVLIGDPKQAIYAFRGGDLHTYLAAASDASASHTLATNWRADPGVVDGVQRVLRGAALGDWRIAVRPVVAGRSGARLGGRTAPICLRVITRENGHVTQGGLLRTPSTRELVAQDVSGVAVDLLTSATLAPDGQRHRPVEPRDMAVLVRTNDQADLVRAHLLRAGVPAVLSGARSIFATEAARDWVTLLRALEEPHRSGLVRAAALTPLVGAPPTDLAATVDGAHDPFAETLRRWRSAWVSRGVPALLEELAAAGLQERLLGTPDGERDLTDVRHVAEVLHDVAVTEKLGPTAQREWLQRQVAQGADGDGEVPTERSRRLESDADAVQVLTIHAAKGLEYPVVLVPYGWDRFVPPRPEVLRLHGADGSRLMDVGGKDGAGYRQRLAVAREEDLGEDLRALYVALTRAASHLVLWWAPATNTPSSPLHRVLFGGFSPGDVPPTDVPVPSDASAARTLHALAADSDGLLAVTRATPHAEPRGSVASSGRSLDGAAEFDRSLDRAWKRLSYTGLTAGAGHRSDPSASTSEPEEAGITDEPDGPVAADDAVVPTQPTRSVAEGPPLVSSWEDLPAGTAFGSLVHGVLEHVDTAAPDLPSHLLSLCRDAVARRLSTTTDPEVLARVLVAAFDTPLGALAHGRTLRDIPPGDHLAELAFELPLTGGDLPGGQRATVADVAAVLARHTPQGDVLADYPRHLEASGLGDRALRGYLVGSIDAVLRIDAPSGRPTYVVADYKTNRLPAEGGSPSPSDYRPERLSTAMIDAHYPLQALLYTVALHRYLRWRQPGYDPECHLGGVQYLFLRGMVGRDAVCPDGQPCGVFAWRPSPDLVVELSDLLARGPA